MPNNNTFLASVKKFIIIFLDSCGILLFPFQPLRAALAVINLSILALLFFKGSRETAYAYVAIAATLNFSYLFLMFKKNGISQWLIKRYGEKHAFEYYKTVQSITFFHYGMSFTVLTKYTAYSAIFSAFTPLTLWFVGHAIGFFGLWMRLWATSIVGIGTYYCQDFFLPVTKGDFVKKGPYRIFNNPMYGIGYLMGYGGGLSYGSLPCIIAVFICQLCIYSFFFLIERPHIIKLYGPSDTPNDNDKNDETIMQDA